MASHVCWSCGAFSHMTRYSEAMNRTLAPGRFLAQAAFYCDQCKTLQIAQVPTGQSLTGGGVEANDTKLTWFPKRVSGQDFEDVPEHIAAAAAEAWQCFSIDAYRAACSLARSVVEATAKEKGITSGVLHAKIEALEEAGHVRAHIKDAAHEIRHLGNETAHGDFIEPITREEADEILVLMGELLQEIFQSPARIERRRAARVAKSTGATN